MENWDTVLNLGTQVVGVFAVIAALTPNRVDNKIAQHAMDVINFGGFNFNKAANRE
jgi:hypothetical protein